MWMKLAAWTLEFISFQIYHVISKVRLCIALRGIEGELVGPPILCVGALLPLCWVLAVSSAVLTMSR